MLTTKKILVTAGFVGAALLGSAGVAGAVDFHECIDSGGIGAPAKDVVTGDPIMMCWGGPHDQVEIDSGVGGLDALHSLGG